VYGHKGVSVGGAVMDVSYTKPNSLIIKNCLFHPTLRNGTLIPVKFDQICHW
jgi:hypothetical protein